MIKVLNRTMKDYFEFAKYFSKHKVIRLTLVIHIRITLAIRKRSSDTAEIARD